MLVLWSNINLYLNTALVDRLVIDIINYDNWLIMMMLSCFRFSRMAYQIKSRCFSFCSVSVADFIENRCESPSPYYEVSLLYSGYVLPVT